MNDLQSKLLFPLGHFYSPIADPDDLRAREHAIWACREDMPGVMMDVGALLAVLRDVGAQARDADYPTDPSPDPTRFHYGNDQYPPLDALFLHGALRHFRPRRMIEVGSGYSSLVTANVNRRYLGNGMEFTCIEPYPRQFLIDGVEGISRLRRQKVEDVEPEFFDRLGENDVLFIDSSHVVKIGSDVNFLLFEVLPRLKPGVLVHIHDIFLPDEYPKVWMLDQGRNWNEQYVVRAFLQYNSAWEIVWAAHYMATRRPTEVTMAFLPAARVTGGGSLWLRRLH